MSGPDSAVSAHRPAPALIPPPNVRRFLLPSEVVRYVDRKHPVVLAPRMALALIVTLLAGFAVAGAGAPMELLMYVAIAALVWLLYRLVRWSRMVLVVTDRRVFEVEALFISRASIRPVFRQSVIFIQDPIGERLNYGTILTETPNGDRVNTFKWIHNPRIFYQAVTDKAV